MFTYLDAFCTPEDFQRFWPDYSCLEELKDHYRRGGLGDVKVKKFLDSILQQKLEPIRNRRSELETDIPAVYEILRHGSETAREAAAKTTCRSAPCDAYRLLRQRRPHQRRLIAGYQ